MSYFKPLEPEGQVAILVRNGVYQQVQLFTRNGVYQQVQLFTRNGYLFAKVGTGFVRLAANGSTSQPSTRIEALVIDTPLFEDRLGRLCDSTVSGAKAIGGSAKQALIGVSE